MGVLLSGEISLSQLVLEANHGAAAGHLRPSDEPGHLAFHTSTKQDDTSDMIASAAVIAELHNILSPACDLIRLELRLETVGRIDVAGPSPQRGGFVS